MTQVTNTGDVDLDITVDGAFIRIAAGATVDVPAYVAGRLGDPFDVGARDLDDENEDEDLDDENEDEPSPEWAADHLGIDPNIDPADGVTTKGA